MTAPPTTVRVLIVGSANDVAVNNLVLNVNSCQPEFHFEAHDEIIEPPKVPIGKNALHTRDFKKLAKRVCRYKYPDELIVIICDTKLEDDDLFYSADGDLAIITTYGWTRRFSPYSLQTYLAHTLANAIMSFHVDTPMHYETRGCLGDYCENKKDINIGLAKCDYCAECRSLILGAIAKGEVTLNQVAAIYKILDYAADRKICFVLMPFEKQFDKVYKRCIKPTLIGQKWACARADEIFEPREIIDLIWEQIHRADLILADLTGKNANVFYELGYAHAMNKQTILITQSIDDAPFDLKHRQLIQYSSTAGGFKNLNNSIIARLQKT
jgi:hypothetical protein